MTSRPLCPPTHEWQAVAGGPPMAVVLATERLALGCCTTDQLIDKIQKAQLEATDEKLGREDAETWNGILAIVTLCAVLFGGCGWWMAVEVLR